MAVNNESGQIARQHPAHAEAAVFDTVKNYNGVYVGTGGNIELLLADDTASVIFTNIQDGQFIPLRITQINIAGTTATGIIGLR